MKDEHQHLQMQDYAMLLQAGVKSINEVRGHMGLTPITSDEEQYVPFNVASDKQ